MEFFTFDCSRFSLEELQALAGNADENIRVLENTLHARILLKNNEIKIEQKEGLDPQAVLELLESCFEWIDERKSLSRQDLLYLIRLWQDRKLKAFEPGKAGPVVRLKSGKMIYPKTLNQIQLVSAMKNAQIVFATGVAGTGKTYLAVAYAVSQLRAEKISRIILTRPAVEAGESLGFLPGDLKEKVDPYLRPLYDALYEMLGQETTERLIEKGVIEIAPLAFMRGRTLNEAVVILDEAQNTTCSQMKMFLTRMGKNTKMIITGDLTQTDLIKKKDSGLIQATDILRGIEGIEMVHLDQSDVVRNPLVSRIIERYAQIEA